MKAQAKPYPELVTQAEEAAKVIKDPELRRVAFERVLDDLLSEGDTSTSSGARAAKKGERSERTTTKPKKRSGPKGYVRELIDDGFFRKPKTIAEVKAELANRGHHIVLSSLSGPLQLLCREHCLRRHKASSGDKTKKVTYNYSEY